MDFCFSPLEGGAPLAVKFQFLKDASIPCGTSQTSRQTHRRDPYSVYFVWSSLCALQIRAWRRESLSRVLYQGSQDQSLFLPSDIPLLVPNALTGRWIPEQQIKGNKGVADCLYAIRRGSAPTPTDKSLSIVILLASSRQGKAKAFLSVVPISGAHSRPSQ